MAVLQQVRLLFMTNGKQKSKKRIFGDAILYHTSANRAPILNVLLLTTIARDLLQPLIVFDLAIGHKVRSGRASSDLQRLSVVPI